MMERDRQTAQAMQFVWGLGAVFCAGVSGWVFASGEAADEPVWAGVFVAISVIMLLITVAFIVDSRA